MTSRRLVSAFLALALAACGTRDPRFGTVTVSATAPRAQLTGHTSASGAPAIELSAGCPGFVDPSTPEHVVHLEDTSAVTITARSTHGPLAIAVVGPSDVRCDSDQGTGHAPHATIDQPGDYVVHVGALEAPADLAYELTIAPAATTPSGAPSTATDARVSVTVTSEPSGATVRTPEGETLGTTPAMFVLTVPSGITERRFVLEMPGYASTELIGQVNGGAMVLHAALQGASAAAAPSVPATTAAIASGTLDATSAAAPQRIRDYHVSTQSLEVPGDCAIGAMRVDLDMDHAYSQDLRIVLRGPTGAEAVLANHSGGARSFRPRTIDFDDARGALHAFAGTSSRGTWTLDVHDDAGADEGTLRGFTLHFTCGDAAVAASSPPSPPTSGTPSTPPPRSTPHPPRVRPTPGMIDPWGPRPTPAPPPPTTPIPHRNGAGGVLLNPF